jgi:ABC-2 type transport system ATP-binding protein
MEHSRAGGVGRPLERIPGHQKEIAVAQRIESSHDTAHGQPMNDSMLTVRNLHKEFTSVTAVDDVSFAVRRGQIFGLLGPNGAGKTTTIRMLMNILEPDSGTILFNGTPMSQDAQNRIGYLPEERGLYRKNKLIHVITYFAALKGMHGKAAMQAAMPWLERFSLHDALHRRVDELSKGNQQKVQFIISVMHDPSFIVLDEVFSGFDPVNQVLIRDALLGLRNDNRAIIFSTHQMEFAEKLCDDLILINKGRVVLSGAPSAIKSSHGRNAIRMEFDGDGGFLRELPGVLRADISPNYAELELHAATPTNDILQACIPRLNLLSFARVEPSLQAIFIETVGQPAQSAPEEPARISPRTAIKDPRVKRQFWVLLVVLLAMIPIVALTARSSDNPMPIALLGIAAVAVSVARFVRVKKKVEKELWAKNGGRAS